MSKKHIKWECRRLRNAGVEGKLRMVPAITDKRCGTPCPDGQCNCKAPFYGEFALVADKYYESLMKEYLEGMVRLQKETDIFLEDYDKNQTRITLEDHSGARS